MKVLKSGVEMTSKELSKLKGGACACGCDESAYLLNSYGHDNGGGCICNCKFNPNGFEGSATAAATYA
jgi:hypothetical protein